MTEPGTTENPIDPIDPSEPISARGRGRGRNRAAEVVQAEDGKRAVGHWVAKLPDGRISMNSSELAALRDACEVGSVAFVGWGETLPPPTADLDMTQPSPDRGFWIGRRASDGFWAGFEREIGARKFACPEGAAQFVRNGETIQL